MIISTRVGTNSLHAGDVMALKFFTIDRDDIKKMGGWNCKIFSSPPQSDCRILGGVDR